MKKIILRVLIIVFVVLVIWIVINRIDARPNPGLLAVKDIPKASLDYSNGFYDLWTLGEPPDVDVSSPQVKEKYRKLFDPQGDYRKFGKEFDHVAYKNMYHPYREKLNQIGTFPSRFGTKEEMNWSRDVLKLREKLSPLDPDLQIFLNRFEKMMRNPVFEDFISLEADAYLPNLLAWLHAAKLYTSINMLKALDGDWETGMSNLLDLLDFAKRAVKGSRFLIVNLIAKAMYSVTLPAIVDLMNQKECPPSLFEMVLSRTPPLQYEEFGTGNSIKCEVVSFTFGFIDHPFSYADATLYNFWERLLLRFFLQKNRTKNYADKFYRQFIAKEQMLPYKWESDFIQIEPFKEGPFWWLWNAGGKIILPKYNDYTGNHKKSPGLYAVIYKSYRNKSFYDMLRISAQLHLNYDPEKPVQEILNSLDSYKNLDPCSGKPYIWNDEKQLLYSIGTDRRDDGGTTNNYQQIEGADFIIPVILYVK